MKTRTTTSPAPTANESTSKTHGWERFDVADAILLGSFALVAAALLVVALLILL